jgi:hypothetical protein
MHRTHLNLNSVDVRLAGQQIMQKELIENTTLRTA